MIYSSQYIMSGNDDNAARKIQSEHPDTEAVDAGWTSDKLETPPLSKKHPKEDIGEVKSGTFHISALIEEALKEGISLRPLELNELKQLGKTGEDLLSDLLSRQPEGSKKQGVVIESGDMVEVKRKVPFSGEEIYVRCQTKPGQKIVKEENEVHKYRLEDVDKDQKHRDGIAVDADENLHQLRIGLTHSVGSHQRDKVLAHLAATSIAYDSSALKPIIDLPEVAEHADAQVKRINKKFKVPSKKGVSLMLAQLNNVYQLDVLTAGDWHCLVLDPQNEEVRSTRVNTVEEDYMEKYSQKGTENWVQQQEGVVHLTPKELHRLSEGSSREEVIDMIYDQLGVGFEDPAQTVTMAANMKNFKPGSTTFETNSGNIVLFLSGPAMQALKEQDRSFLKAFDEEQQVDKEMTQDRFADLYFGGIINKELKKGRSLEEVVDELIQKTKGYRDLQEYKQYPGITGGAVDTSTTIVGFTIPDKI